MNIDVYNKELVKWANRHNWGSLESSKGLILRHLRTFTGDFVELPTTGILKEDPSLNPIDVNGVLVTLFKINNLDSSTGRGNTDG